MKIKAKISLLNSRTNPIMGSYRPNHNFGDIKNTKMLIGFIDFENGEMLHPGESKEMEISFWYYPGIDFYVGRLWRIQEGKTLVGFGEIIEILNEDR